MLFGAPFQITSAKFDIAAHDLRRDATRRSEQPAPAQRHKAPVQRRTEQLINEPERMAPLV